MSFSKRTIKDVDVAGKRVLLRADYNVPIVRGRVSEDYRITQSIPTIKYLLDHGCDGLVIISHLGRPAGKRNSDFSLAPVARHLEQLLGKKVGFAKDCIGEEVVYMANKLKAGDILMLENVRFHAGEEANDDKFARAIVEATGAEVFVQDGFGVVHRAHATTSAITKLLPSVAGLLLEKEVLAIEQVIKSPARPLTAVIGGAKISDKIELIKRFIELADCIAVGGAMANNFLLALGHPVGKSLAEKKLLPEAKEIIRLAQKASRDRSFQFLIPVDVVVAKSADGHKPTRVVDIGHSLADIEAYPKRPSTTSYTIGADEMVLDIGPASSARIAGVIQMSKMVIWNGTCGVTEVKGIAGAQDPFAHGTKTVVQAIIGSSRAHKNKPESLVGGGDTVSYIEQNKLLDEFNHVSTGGGAALELMAGHTLPGVAALQNR